MIRFRPPAGSGAGNPARAVSLRQLLGAGFFSFGPWAAMAIIGAKSLSSSARRRLRAGFMRRAWPVRKKTGGIVRAGYERARKFLSRLKKKADGVFFQPGWMLPC